MGHCLAQLRQEGVLILGSGNVVHNLRQLGSVASAPYPWAAEFDVKVKELILKKQYEGLLEWDAAMKEIGELSHPSIDHYLPLLYCLGASEPTDQVKFPFEGFQYGSISMRTILWQ
jgi:4,5-DOPA dioxygenase extradiol